MGLFGNLFGGGSREDKENRRIRELSKRTQEKYGDAAGRTRALEQLRDIGSPEAIYALLQRFTVKTEPGITDAEEKDFTFSIVTSFGENAVQPIVDFIRQNDSVAWGVRCLAEVVEEDRLVEILTAELDKLASEYSREPDKKVVIINHLAEIRDPRIGPAVTPFLEDAVDEVRVAAMQNLVAQEETAAGDALVACLLGAEAPRVRAAAAEALAALGVNVGARQDEVAARLPASFTVDGGVVRKR